VLAAALAVELVDELVDGTKSAALPLIRQSLDLSYGQIGLLASVPLLLGGLLELPLGVLAGHGRRRRRAVRADRRARGRRRLAVGGRRAGPGRGGSLAGRGQEPAGACFGRPWGSWPSASG